MKTLYRILFVLFFTIDFTFVVLTVWSRVFADSSQGWNALGDFLGLGMILLVAGLIVGTILLRFIREHLLFRMVLYHGILAALIIASLIIIAR